MTVPSRNVRDSTTLLDFGADNDVLEDLVQGVARMQAAIGVGGSIVKKEALAFWSMLGLPLVKVVGALFDVLLSLLRQRSRARLSRLLAWRRLARTSAKAYGNFDFGSLNVDDQFFDMIT